MGLRSRRAPFADRLQARRPDVTRSLIILGPTAVGKSALALLLAARREGEIVALDSMQVYAGMEIGTAAPSADERARCPHHLFGCLPLHMPSDAAAMLARVRAAEADIRERRRLPILVGGTALYIKLLVDGMFDGPAADHTLRAELAALAAQHGSDYLHQRLLAPVDPVSAARLHPHDLRRVIRAIEVHRTTGRPLSEQQRQWSAADQSCDYTMIGLTLARDALYARIDARVDAMLAAGLLAEVMRLRDEGIEANPTARQAIGYRELLAHLRGECSLNDAVVLIKRNSRRFAKHQLTWFRRDARICWFDPSRHATTADLADAVEAVLDGRAQPQTPPPPRLPR
jgi:tRNA dimethylallyltransferase